LNEVGALPPSIVDILGQDRGYVILVNGKPGVGKTMLAQEIARTFPDTFTIITSSENTANYKQVLTQVHPEWDRHHAAVPFWRSDLGDDMSRLSLSEQLSTLTGKTVQLDGYDIIVIDSWTDFLAPYELAKRSELEHALTETARRERKRLVLISDCSEDNPCSSGTLRAADGVVTLNRLREEQRVYRRIIIEKMRGVPIEQDEFLFTLHGGRFTYIPWYQHRYPAITVEREPISDPSKDMISTGSRSLDRVLGGGFQKGALNLVELESITAPYLETLYIPFLSNQLQLGRPVIIVLPEGWSSERFVHGLSHFVDKKTIDECVVFFGRQALGRIGNVRPISDDPSKTLQEIRYEANQLARRFDKEVTEFFALDALENKFGPVKTTGMVAEITASLPETETATIMVLGRQQTISSSSLPHSVHIVVREICGVIGIYGISPKTGFLALRPRLTGGFLDYDLLPVL